MENSVLKDVKFNGKFGLKGFSSKESGHKIFDTLTFESVCKDYCFIFCLDMLQ